MAVDEVQGQVEDAIVNVLLSDPGLVATFQRRVYLDTTPDATVTEFVIVRFLSGGDVQDSQRAAVDLEYLVECYSTNLSRARLGAQRIRETLHLQQLALVGFDNYFTCEMTRISMAEQHDGLTYFRRGAQYLFRTAKRT